MPIVRMIESVSWRLVYQSVENGRAFCGRPWRIKLYRGEGQFRGAVPVKPATSIPF